MARNYINFVSLASNLTGSIVPSDSWSSFDEERTPFVSTIASFLFMALINRRKKKEAQKLTPEAANKALFESIQKEAGYILFWSSNQHLLLKGDYMHVKFSSDYGTGQ